MNQEWGERDQFFPFSSPWGDTSLIEIKVSSIE
jgi:hypothetical protein